MLWSLASQVGKHWPQSRPASGHGQRWCPPGSQPQRQHCSAFCLQPALSTGTERFTEHRFCEGHGSHDSHPGRCCQSQVTGCGAAGTRTGHAQVLGRKHSTPSTSPSLEESGRKLPCSPFSGHNHQKKMFHPTGGRKALCHSVSASTSLLIAGVSDRKSRRTLSRDAEPA